jgi:Beta-lactamase
MTFKCHRQYSLLASFLVGAMRNRAPSGKLRRNRLNEPCDAPALGSAIARDGRPPTRYRDALRPRPGASLFSATADECGYHWMAVNRPEFRSGRLAGAFLMFSLLLRLCIATAATVPDDAKLERFLSQAMADDALPEMALAIVKEGKVTLAKGYGLTGDGQPLKADTPVLIASLSKAMTAAVALMLVAEARIDLDAPVQRYLPVFLVQFADGGAAITVRHLLNQTSRIAAMIQTCCVKKSLDGADMPTSGHDQIASIRQCSAHSRTSCATASSASSIGSNTITPSRHASTATTPTSWPQ